MLVICYHNHFAAALFGNCGNEWKALNKVLSSFMAYSAIQLCYGLCFHGFKTLEPGYRLKFILWQSGLQLCTTKFKQLSRVFKTIW